MLAAVQKCFSFRAMFILVFGTFASVRHVSQATLCVALQSLEPLFLNCWQPDKIFCIDFFFFPFVCLLMCFWQVPT